MRAVQEWVIAGCSKGFQRAVIRLGRREFEYYAAVVVAVSVAVSPCWGGERGYVGFMVLIAGADT
jgi:hypothetical protein